MTESLSDLFTAAQYPKIEWDGAAAYALWQVSPVPEQLIVEFRGGTDFPVQGLAIKLEGGVLRANGTEAKQLALWHDTAPSEVCVEVSSTGKAKLSVWNVWRGAVGGHDVTQAWLGNSGMRIEHSVAGEVILRCSDGVGPIDFGDFIVSLRAMSGN